MDRFTGTPPQYELEYLIDKFNDEVWDIIGDDITNDEYEANENMFNEWVDEYLNDDKSPTQTALLIVKRFRS